VDPAKQGPCREALAWTSWDDAKRRNPVDSTRPIFQKFIKVANVDKP
jgi:hypothetical protein